MDSPFCYDKIALKDKFFGRDDEIARMDEFVAYSNNLLIYSKRRIGKTTLVKNFLQKHANDSITIYADIFDITSKEDFAKELLKALTNADKSDIKNVLKSFASMFKRVRVEPTIDPVTLEYSIKPIVKTLSFEEMMEDFFHSLEELSRKRDVVVAIDEFQEIASIKDTRLDAMLRKKIQERSNVSYIFLGSKRHLLTSLFEYKAPLYEMATHFALGALKIDDVWMYAKRYLNIDIEVLEYLYEVSDAETKLLLNVLHLLYIQKSKEITKDSIDEALNIIIDSKEATFRMIFDTLSINQKSAIKVLGKYDKKIFSKDVLNEFNVNKQTLKSSIDSLYKKELIDKEDGRYFIPDRVFELWIKRVFGN